MTRRAPSFARAFTGRWRITEMDEWDEIDLAGSAHITFSGKDRGELAFLAVEADLDVRYGTRDGAACAEFSWEGFDDGTAASGRGWAAFGGAGRLVGHIFIHKGDDSGFVAEREGLNAEEPMVCVTLCWRGESRANSSRKIEFAKPGFWDADGKMDPFPQAVGLS